MASKRLPVQMRKEIFRTLVSTQDLGLMTVRQSLEHVAKQFAISEEQLDEIVEEGTDKGWPPFDEAPQTVG
jgi:hypothetical protein